MASSSESSHQMEYRFLGNSGLLVSALSLGAWVTWGDQVDDEVAFQCTKAAYEAGCNFFDNAEVYAGGKAEETMGRVLKRLNIPRSELVISTKIFWGGKKPNLRGLSRKHIIEGMNASLQRLQLDYVDLMFCHRPDFYTPMEEVVRACNWLIEQGKVFYWGTSEWSAEQIQEAHAVAARLNLIPPLMEQPQYSMLHRTRFEKEYDPLYKKHKMGTTIWSPLASGLLTGKYSKNPEDFPPDSRLAGVQSMEWMRKQLLSGEGMNGLEEKDLDAILDKVEKLKPIAKKLDCTLAQLAIAWCAKNPNVSTVITGASRAEQVVENFKSLQVLPKLTPEVLAEIEEALQNKPTPPPDARYF
ncbi:Voltage-gated potassium channel subunit beta-1 [Balamuthia mandrillaris]